MADYFSSLLPGILWWIALLPLLAGGVIALLPDRRGKLACTLAIGALSGSMVIALLALLNRISHTGALITEPVTWFVFGDTPLRVGLLLDPLSAGMAAMVTFVAFWIFVYSSGYMAEEKRFGRFFGFLSLFCGAMLLVVLSNSLLLLFIAWELVGLASYLLIGFYFEKPSAAAAAQKAFITTRVGDMAFFIGLIWLNNQSGTLLFHDGGRGLLESGALNSLAGATAICGLSASAAAGLLLFIGAMGKSGQVPLHTWLPDAM
ncbi:MAG TPA: proton-conducting transporter membrane subunit, partial [Luteolibacter sp.]|nr:proton-conducting transporter membrane subunit [Luteolibacter sp.]